MHERQISVKLPGKFFIESVPGSPSLKLECSSIADHVTAERSLLGSAVHPYIKKIMLKRPNLGKYASV